MLLQEGKRLLRRALAHDDEEQGSVDFSIVTNRDDASADSDLESFLEWEQQDGNGNGNSGGGAAQKKRNRNKWKGQQYGDDVERHDDLESAMDELTEKRDATKVQALQKVTVHHGINALGCQYCGLVTAFSLCYHWHGDRS